MGTQSAILIGSDPIVNNSYGILARYMIRSTNYDWHVMAIEKKIGRPVKRTTPTGKIFTVWDVGRNLTAFKEKYQKIIQYEDPLFVLSIMDIQHMQPIHKMADLPWIHWLPIDNDDATYMNRHKGKVHAVDIPVTMSKHGLEFCIQHDWKVSDYIYPFISPTYRKLPEENVQAFRENYDLYDKKIILYVGRPGWRKHLEFTLGVYKMLDRDDTLLYLHTDRYDEAKTFDFGRMIHALDIPLKNVRFTEDIQGKYDKGMPEEWLCHLYNAADVYLATHGGEGFGMPMAESLACGTPVVGTDFTSTKEIVGNDERGYAIPVRHFSQKRGVYRAYIDMDIAAQKVNRLLDDECMNEKMGEKGIEWSKTLSLDTIANKWEEIFSRLEVQKCKI